MPSFEFEEKYLSEGYKIICGTDEAGRGPLAGPVCAAAVILPLGYMPEDLNDSKKLTEKKRDLLFNLIKENAISYGIAFASVEEIDSLNILNASQLAMRRAVAMLSPTPDLVLVDGNVARGFEMKAVPIVKGDFLSASISAASILAKTARDRLMKELDEQYPEYQLSKHKGYPTPLHMQLVRELGPSPIHRKKFIRFLDEEAK